MINRTRRSFTALMLILSILLTTMPASSVTVATIDAEALSKESQIFNYVHREVFEENAHVQRLTAEESLDSYVFLNADGSRTAYFLDEQVKFVDAKGTVQEKDITLTYASNTFSTTRNNVGLQIPTNLSTGVRLSYGGYDVSIVPQGSSLTLPRRTDNSVVYDNYFGTGTRLIYTPTLDGVKEDIVLTSYRGISSFTFLLNTDGLRVYRTAEDRWYLAEYEEAEMRFWLGNVEVYDANLKPSLGIMTVEPIAEGQRYRLTISADPNFLTDPATAYPVTIDPTIRVSDTANGAGAIEDAPIYEGYPTSNFGTYQYNRAGYAGTAYKRGRTVVRLKGLFNNASYMNLPATRLNSVEFYIWDASGTAASNVHLYPIETNATWTEAGVTWNSISGAHFSSKYVTAGIGGGNLACFDITALAQKWKVDTFNGNCGFILIGANEASVDRSLYSSEHSTSSKRPYVVVDYCTDAYGSYYSGSNYFFNSHWRYGTINNVEGQPEAIPLYYDDGLQLRSNCYGYAFRLYYSEAFTDDMIVYRDGLSGRVEIDDYYAYKQIPGEFADKEEGLGIWDVGTNAPCVDILYDRFDLDNFYEDYIFKSTLSNETRMHYLVQLIRADANTLGYTVTEYTGTSIPTPTPESEKRLIAVVVNQPTGSSENSSFHFYMQHSDGSWSHKNGHAQPLNVCFNCRQVLDSTIRAHASEGPYANGLVKFFYIEKSVEDTNHRNGIASTTVRTIAP